MRAGGSLGRSLEHQAVCSRSNLLPTFMGKGSGGRESGEWRVRQEGHLSVKLCQVTEQTLTVETDKTEFIFAGCI